LSRRKKGVHPRDWLLSVSLRKNEGRELAWEDKKKESALHPSVQRKANNTREKKKKKRRRRYMISFTKRGKEKGTKGDVVWYARRPGKKEPGRKKKGRSFSRRCDKGGGRAPFFCHAYTRGKASRTERKRGKNSVEGRKRQNPAVPGIEKSCPQERVQGGKGEGKTR